GELHQRINRVAGEDAGARRLISTIGVLAASGLIVGLAWLNRLSNEAARPVAGNWVARHAWEDVAVTLRPDPGTLPRKFAPDQQFAAGYDVQLADWMLNGLGQKVDR